MAKDAYDLQVYRVQFVNTIYGRRGTGIHFTDESYTYTSANVIENIAKDSSFELKSFEETYNYLKEKGLSGFYASKSLIRRKPRITVRGHFGEDWHIYEKHFEKCSVECEYRPVYLSIAQLAKLLRAEEFLQFCADNSVNFAKELIK